MYSSSRDDIVYLAIKVGGQGQGLGGQGVEDMVWRTWWRTLGGLCQGQGWGGQGGEDRLGMILILPISRFQKSNRSNKKSGEAL